MNKFGKKPGVAFWATVVAVVVLIYLLSIGPACWVTSRLNTGAEFVPIVYRPITLLFVESDHGIPQTTRRPLAPGPRCPHVVPCGEAGVVRCGRINVTVTNYWTRSAFRNKWPPDARANDIGLRPALVSVRPVQ
jgi:hypothetical protein